MDTVARELCQPLAVLTVGDNFQTTGGLNSVLDKEFNESFVYPYRFQVSALFLSIDRLISASDFCISFADPRCPMVHLAGKYGLHRYHRVREQRGKGAEAVLAFRAPNGEIASVSGK